MFAEILSIIYFSHHINIIDIIYMETMTFEVWDIYLTFSEFYYHCFFWTCLGVSDSSVSDGVLVKVVGHEELNSSAPFSSSPSGRLSGTGSAAPSPFILKQTKS